MGYSLTAVARPAAASSGAPTHSAGGQPGRLAEPRKDVMMQFLLASTKSRLRFNDISISYNGAQEI